MGEWALLFSRLSKHLHKGREIKIPDLASLNA